MAGEHEQQLLVALLEAPLAVAQDHDRANGAVGDEERPARAL